MLQGARMVLVISFEIMPAGLVISQERKSRWIVRVKAPQTIRKRVMPIVKKMVQRQCRLISRPDGKKRGIRRIGKNKAIQERLTNQAMNRCRNVGGGGTV